MSQVPYIEVVEAIIASGGEKLLTCYQCATCTGTCPWSQLVGYNMRKLIHMAQHGYEGIEELIWECSTCGHCVERCPRGVETIDIIRAIRRVFGEGGLLPAPLRTMVGSMQANGNPWSGDAADRLKWADGLDLPAYNGQEYLWFVCCTISYDPRNKGVGKAVANLMKKAGVNFGIFGTEMNCCAESLGKVEGGELTEKLMNNNRKLFKDKGVKKCLVTSPHCLDTFRKEYDVAGLEPIHAVTFFADLIEQGKLKPTKNLGGLKVTYHDPCYLGRHNKEYESPRKILQAIPGVELVEMERIRENSFCCGGGGGKMWAEVEAGHRPSDKRMAEAKTTGASVVATACPYCISMLEDSCKTGGYEDTFKIYDVLELLDQAVE